MRKKESDKHKKIQKAKTGENNSNKLLASSNRVRTNNVAAAARVSVAARRKANAGCDQIADGAAPYSGGAE
jgi:hypothetical protein